MSVKKRKAPSSKSSLRRQRKSQSNAALPIAVGALALLLLVVLVAKSGGSSSPTTTARVDNKNTKSDKTEIVENEVVEKQSQKETSKLDNAEKVEVVTKKTGLITYETSGDGAAEATDSTSPVDNQPLQELKVEIRQLALERKWDEAFALIDNYNGPYKQDISLMRREVEARKSSSEEIAKAYEDDNIDAVPRPVVQNSAPQRQIVKDEKPSALKPLGNGPQRKVPVFEKESEWDRKKKKKAPNVNLIVHSQKVGIPQHLIVVWKDRTNVLSYSRLIKALDNRNSRFYEERVEKAKKFLEEKKDYYALIPYAKAKMSLRRRGLTVSEVFFNMDGQTDEYGNTESGRYKGYVISYDIRWTTAGGGGFSMGC